MGLGPVCILSKVSSYSIFDFLAWFRVNVEIWNIALRNSNEGPYFELRSSEFGKPRCSQNSGLEASAHE